MSGNTVLEANGLTKTFDDGGTKIRAVDGVSLDIKPGSVVGILGPNGAGKTTTIRMMLGLITPDEGEVIVDGVDVHESPGRAFMKVGGMLEGSRNAYWRLTVQENLRYFASLAGYSYDQVRDRHEALLEMFELASKADTPVKSLSRGQKQKVSLASALARRTTVLLLDEPTLGMDVTSSLKLQRELTDLVDRTDVSFVVSSHDMELVQSVCDRVIIMNEGRKIVDDSVDELLGVFDTQGFRIVLSDVEDSRLRDELCDEFAVDEWVEQDDRIRFEVSSNSEEFYRLIGVLELFGCEVVNVETIQPDLETVFLERTRADD